MQPSTSVGADRHGDLWWRISRLVDGASPARAWSARDDHVNQRQGALADMVLDRAAAAVGSTDCTVFQLLSTVLRTRARPPECTGCASRSCLRSSKLARGCYGLPPLQEVVLRARGWAKPAGYLCLIEQRRRRCREIG